MLTLLSVNFTQKKMRKGRKIKQTRWGVIKSWFQVITVMSSLNFWKIPSYRKRFLQHDPTRPTLYIAVFTLFHGWFRTPSHSLLWINFLHLPTKQNLPRDTSPLHIYPQTKRPLRSLRFTPSCNHASFASVIVFTNFLPAHLKFDAYFLQDPLLHSAPQSPSMKSLLAACL